MNVKNPYQLKNRKNKIAVLIGQRTSSSGEMTAITFIGQQNTRLFGAPSGGFIARMHIKILPLSLVQQ